MDKVCQTDTGADQQSQPGAAVSAAEQDRGQPQALQTGWGKPGQEEFNRGSKLRQRSCGEGFLSITGSPAGLWHPPSV